MKSTFGPNYSQPNIMDHISSNNQENMRQLMEKYNIDQSEVEKTLKEFPTVDQLEERKKQEKLEKDMRITVALKEKMSAKSGKPIDFSSDVFSIMSGNANVVQWAMFEQKIREVINSMVLPLQIDQDFNN